MIRHDLDHWPLVLSVADGSMSFEEHLAFLSDWTGWLERGEPFATLRIFSDLDSLHRPEGGAKEAKAWLQANGDSIRHLVVGMATVVPAQALDEVSKMNAEKLFGVPARSFDNATEAAKWLMPLMQAKGIAVDPDDIMQDLHALRQSS